MGFKTTSWTLENINIPEYIVPEEGPQYLFIKNATCDETDKSAPYKITLESLSNEAVFTLSYWMYASDRNTGEFIPSTKQCGTLITLGKALAGKSIGIPNPVDIIGGVVLANVIMEPSKKDPSKTYARVYEFEPVPKDIAELAAIDQYYIGQENETPSEQ